jgi:hypothetical protein
MKTFINGEETPRVESDKILTFIDGAEINTQIKGIGVLKFDLRFIPTESGALVAPAHSKSTYEDYHIYIHLSENENETLIVISTAAADKMYYFYGNLKEM